MNVMPLEVTQTLYELFITDNNNNMDDVKLVPCKKQFHLEPWTGVQKYNIKNNMRLLLTHCVGKYGV
jgi:predicted RNA-binding protein with PUA-like domain